MFFTLVFSIVNTSFAAGNEVNQMKLIDDWLNVLHHNGTRSS